MSFGDWDYSSALGAVEAPVLVIFGDRDTGGTATQEEWVAAFPHARMLLVQGAGKGALADRPDVVVPAITAFIRDSLTTR